MWWSLVILRAEPDTMVLMADEVTRRVRTFAIGAEGKTEAGGILIGCYRGPHLEITDCTVPLARDVRRTFLFDRKDTGHARAAADAWRDSGSVLTYVGEWHTHPEDHPTPSALDSRTWRSVRQGRREEFMMFLIVGRRGIWSAIGNSAGLVPLRVLDD